MFKYLFYLPFDCVASMAFYTVIIPWLFHLFLHVIHFCQTYNSIHQFLRYNILNTSQYSVFASIIKKTIEYCTWYTPKWWQDWPIWQCTQCTTCYFQREVQSQEFLNSQCSWIVNAGKYMFWKKLNLYLVHKSGLTVQWVTLPTKIV